MIGLSDEISLMLIIENLNTTLHNYLVIQCNIFRQWNYNII